MLKCNTNWECNLDLKPGKIDALKWSSLTNKTTSATNTGLDFSWDAWWHINVWFSYPKSTHEGSCPPPQKIELILHKCIFCAHIMCIFSQPDLFKFKIWKELQNCCLAFGLLTFEKHIKYCSVIVVACVIACPAVLYLIDKFSTRFWTFILKMFKMMKQGTKN